MLNWLNSQGWVRPLLGIGFFAAQGLLSAQAFLGVNHPTVAGNVATAIVALFGSAGVASLGRSNSGLAPSDGNKIPLPALK